MSGNFELPSETIEKSKKKKKRNSRRLLILIFAVFLLVLAGTLLAIVYLPNFSQVPPYDYFADMREDSASLVLRDERLGMAPVIIDGDVYVPVDFVKEYLDKYIFWEEGANSLTITTADKVIRMNTDELDYFINHQPFQLNLPVRNLNSEAYLPMQLIETLYPIEISYADAYNIVIADLKTFSKQMGRITAKTSNMRYEPNIKSPIEKKLAAGDEITVYAQADGGFTKIRTRDGLLGYVYTKDFEETTAIPAGEQRQTEYAAVNFNGKVVMAWDQIYRYEDNARSDKFIAQKALNVLAPTWFSFDEDTLDGSMLNIADINYVNFAHENDMQVWAVVTDSFKSKVSDAVLKDPDVRDYVIKQLLEFTAIYGLDGINIDFEMVSEGTAPYFLQFLRELSPLLREQEVILSVCMFVPTYTMHYNRTEVAKAVSYICVMAYDEHYGPASGSGPVASLFFVEDGIKRTLAEVPKEKLILGMPFFTRVWKERKMAAGIEASVERNAAMGYAEPSFEENGSEITWLSDIGSYYGEYTAELNGETVMYKAWFEDERSIAEKLKLFEKYELAGVAGWSRNLETDEIWDLIDEYINE